MIRTLPYLARGLLLIVLVLASVATGALRGQAQAAGSAVFCIGLVPQVMAVDADGQPVSAHHCPDCTFSGLAALLPDALRAPDALPRDSLRVWLAPQPCDSLSALPPRVRGPPVSV